MFRRFIRYVGCLVPLTALGHAAGAQPHADTTSHPHQTSPAVRRDVTDLMHQVFRHHSDKVPHDSATLANGGKFVSILPQVGYTLQTSLLVQLLGNVIYQRPGANISSLIGTATYTLDKQAMLIFTSTRWSAHNKLNWLTDWRLMHYPQGTFGLGIINTSLDRVISMDYEYLRMHQQVLKRISPNLYAGLGYALDLHWDIVSRNRNNRDVVQISRYRYGVEGRSVSSGPLLSVQFDNRSNAINAAQGLFARVQYRSSLQALGSDQNYETMLLEARTYLRPSARSANVLAFWSYNALTLGGDPPFLDLFSTGWDTYSNTGRGYVQGRFRGRNLLYFESEYRFGLTRNGLLGGVAFANAQSVTEVVSGNFQRIAPAAGAGLRLSMNKITRTNLAIDYAFGVDGSRGLFFNLGEVF